MSKAFFKINYFLLLMEIMTSKKDGKNSSSLFKMFTNSMVRGDWEIR